MWDVKLQLQSFLISSVDETESPAVLHAKKLQLVRIEQETEWVSEAGDFEGEKNLLLLLLLLLIESGYVPGGSGTTIHKKQKITHTHSKQYTTQKLQT